MLHPRLDAVPPWMQENSVPDRSTPRSCTVFPDPSTRWLPLTRMASPPGPGPGFGEAEAGALALLLVAVNGAGDWGGDGTGEGAGDRAGVREAGPAGAVVVEEGVGGAAASVASPRAGSDTRWS